MKNKKYLLLVVVGVLCAGCDLRMDVGEDLHSANRIELTAIKENLSYFVDDYGNCFATLNNYTAQHRSTFTLASIDCDKMP